MELGQRQMIKENFNIYSVTTVTFISKKSMLFLQKKDLVNYKILALLCLNHEQLSTFRNQFSGVPP